MVKFADSKQIEFRYDLLHTFIILGMYHWHDFVCTKLYLYCFDIEDRKKWILVWYFTMTLSENYHYVINDLIIFYQLYKIGLRSNIKVMPHERLRCVWSVKEFSLLKPYQPKKHIVISLLSIRIRGTTIFLRVFRQSKPMDIF